MDLGIPAHPELTTASANTSQPRQRPAFGFAARFVRVRKDAPPEVLPGKEQVDEGDEERSEDRPERAAHVTACRG